MKIRRDDQVVVIAGNHASSEPRKVIDVIDGGKRIVVEGVNLVHKHVRRGHPRSPQGGRLHMEMPIDTSNVQIYCGACERGTRTGYRYQENGAKERFCRKCGQSHGAISPARTRYASNPS